MASLITYFFMRQLIKMINQLMRGCCLALIVILMSAASNFAFAEYRLGTGDKIQVEVYDEVDLGLTTVLSQSGIISYPFLGELRIVDLTPKEVEQLIVNGLKGTYLVDPQVSVTILEYRPFYINGEVKQSGGYPYQPGLTVRRAISLAGGFTDKASKTKITIIRERDSQKAPTPVVLDDLVNPGDTVIVGQGFF